MTRSDSSVDQVTRLIREGAAGLFPGYFAVVMATGATSIASNMLGHHALAVGLLVINCLVFGALCFLTVVRLIWFPGSLVQDMVSHSKGPGFFTLIAGTCILGAQFQLLPGWSDVAAAFWWLGLILWGVIMYLFFVVITTRQDKPTLDTGINGAWLLAAVSTQSVSILTTLVPWSGSVDIRLFFALCMFMIGCMLYMAIITLIFYRLTFLKLNAQTFSPPYWISMGAVAITALAGSTLITRGQQGSLLADFLPFIRGFTVFFWAVASWWIPLLIGLTLWRHVIQRHRLEYDPQLWSMVFPLAMYTTGTARLADVLGIEFLMVIPATTLWVALGAWFLTSLGMSQHFIRKIRIVSGDAA